MTDSLNGVTVVFERDIREDDAEAILTAIRMIKGVASVEPHVSTVGDHFARTQAAHEFKMKLYAFIDELK